MKFDKITFEIITEEDTSKEVIQFSVKLIINDKKIRVPFDPYYFILSAKTGKYEMLTCTCGNAGCAGYWNGIFVKHRKKNIEWRLDSKEGYTKDDLGAMFYSFEPEQYFNARHTLFNELMNMSKTYSAVIDEFGHDITDDNLQQYKKALEGKRWYE